MVAPGPARSTRRRPPMSRLVQIFVARAKFSGLRGRAHSIEGGGIDSFEAKLVADAGEKNLAAPGIEHLDRRAADPVPAGGHGAAGDERLAAHDQQRSGRRWRPWHGATRGLEFFRQAAKKRESGCETMQIIPIARPEMQADASRGRQTQ